MIHVIHSTDSNRTLAHFVRCTQHQNKIADVWHSRLVLHLFAYTTNYLFGLTGKIRLGSIQRQYDEVNMLLKGKVSAIVCARAYFYSLLMSLPYQKVTRLRKQNNTAAGRLLMNGIYLK